MPTVMIILGTYMQIARYTFSKQRANVVKHDCMFIDHGTCIHSTLGSVLVIYRLKQAGCIHTIRLTSIITA